MADNHETFVRAFLAEYYEHRFVTGRLNEERFYAWSAELITSKFEQCAHELFARSPAPVNVPGAGAMRLIHLREMDGSEFPFLLAAPRRKRPAGRALTCFVGHRFRKEIERPLRFNLTNVLNPHRIALVWSAQDLSASDVFRDIVRAIRRAHMCFFDNRDTADRPNVYIEVGIAYAFRIPTILTEFVEPGATETVGATIPSDLQGLFRIRYSSYSELFRKLYFGLPSFIAKNRIHRR